MVIKPEPVARRWLSWLADGLKCPNRTESEPPEGGYSKVVSVMGAQSNPLQFYGPAAEKHFGLDSSRSGYGTSS